MFSFFGLEACGILAPWPGIEPELPALVYGVTKSRAQLSDWTDLNACIGRQGVNHQLTKEVLLF